MNDIRLYADGIHDDTAAIQAMLDRRGTVELGCGSYLISRPLIIHDDTHFRLSAAATLRLKDGANCSLLDNDGLYEHRVNRNITIEGGIWDGRGKYQTRESIPDENVPFDFEKYLSNSLLVLMIRLVHTENLTVKNVTFKDPTSFAIQIADVKYFTVENVFFDFDLSKPNMDGIHIQGPARFGRISNVRGDANDDHVALCANGTTRSEITRGDIEDIDIDGIYCENGYTGVRLLSRGDAVRNIRISNVHGAFRFYAVSFTHHYPLREDMPVLLENIRVSNVFASKSTGKIPVDWHRSGVMTQSLIWFEQGITCRNVTVENLCRNERNVETVAPTIRIDENVSAENLTFINLNQRFPGKPLPLIENKGNVPYTLTNES